MGRIGVVVIGRNEGERLRRCLGSLLGRGAEVVYVDSGSTDGSAAMARSLGVEVIDLDMSVPFTAARGRNTGMERLLQRCPDVDVVQFVDGDCEVAAGWLELAAAELRRRPELGVVCGRRRERFPEQSIYNRLCDLEWDTPIGEARACGGDAMVRTEALQRVGGYDPTLIAGEEPELCFRIRQAGWKVWRLDAEMTLHDAAIHRFKQWWKRAVRAGHAYTEGAWMHGRSAERHFAKNVRSIAFWGVGLPVIVLVLAWPTRGWSLWLLLGYAVLWVRIARGQRAMGRSAADSRLYATFTVIGKFAEAWGMVRFLVGRLLKRRSRIIEYK